MEDIFKQISGNRPSKKTRFPQTFKVGETVRIVSGTFASFMGKIEGINKDKALLLVRVKILGRIQPVKINFIDAVNIPDK